MSKLIIVKVFAEFYEKYNGCECGKCNARINGTEQMKYQYKIFFIFFFFFISSFDDKSLPSQEISREIEKLVRKKNQFNRRLFILV